MNNKTIIIIIAGTFILLFATSFLLDIQIVSRSIARVFIIYLLMIVELLIGFLLLKEAVK
jgi:hypothetical protein